MKTITITSLANLVTNRRKEKHMTQQDLADITGINRSMISRLEKKILFLLFLTQGAIRRNA